ncbi:MULTISPECIES: Gfo/Idh/MocA family protein [unclassified Saccharopolyspora]|uniref:Gfo/Idh/MocA family protein n=1 Tax=unclassified Saccharopolyspora TaxID=2646250 RepID=UPI001CD1C9AC|nr:MULTISPECIES: Gfo/Idh/MocA family oxidoreductase [unclassified Saccharopolyspora]MCA1187534.1 Gfo/Idh/MocA family oxidoreductase [Saccharopolyspora sp. 6T]MCA1191951.1 Gfo/Idh/MocA family oxidoreductase [Saccharopolyspora sp. 6V]MCA1224874.1 Gfo/Idh/MocA family oxidoreductase [Saccharopolyspora sp. 6M]MCA1279781.1 Gfo/Idh/MocA family oxidoreductase [Saccharopolyspora sp. 7B]
MTERRLGVVMNGVTGRMGYRQHLVRSILDLREQGGVPLSDGTRVRLDPILVGRDPAKLAELAARHDLDRWTTDLDTALSEDDDRLYFDAQVTSAREAAITRAIAAGKHVYTEKPIAADVPGALRLARAARDAGIRAGVVHDKLYLPGLLKLRRLVESGFFGRILSVRGEFGYWVFEGDLRPAQRPSWNYRAEDGGGITTDMFPHWNYLLENLFGRVEAVTARVVTHIPRRWDEQGRGYAATADDAAYATFELTGGVVAQLNSSWATRVHRDELVEFHVDGTHGSAVAGLHRCRAQHRAHTPAPVWNPDLVEATPFREQWPEVPDDGRPTNGFRAQWEQFVRHLHDDGEHPYDFLAGVRGLRLAEAGLASSREGRRVELDEVVL